MGKSGAAKKKKVAVVSTSKDKVDADNVTFLDRARELKEEGNQLFKSSQFTEAYEKYGQALKLAPEGHEDRAFLFSNRAAAMLGMRPVPYDDVIKECTAALELKPKFGRALLRRAKANEALANYRMALDDVETLLESEADNEDAKEAQKRLLARIKLGIVRGAAPPPSSLSTARVNPTQQAATGTTRMSASSDKVAPVANDGAKSGASLPSRSAPPTPKGVPGLGLETKVKPKAVPGRPEESEGHGVERSQANGVHKNANLNGMNGSHLNPSGATSSGAGESSGANAMAPSSTGGAAKEGPVEAGGTGTAGEVKVTQKARQGKKKGEMKPLIQLKLVYDRGNDLRKAEMPRNCGPWGLRQIVQKRFPSAKGVLIKYEDEEGDRVTITNREEFEAGIAGYLKQYDESSVEVLTASGTASGETTLAGVASMTEKARSAVEVSSKKQQGPLKLYIVEVDPDQEPTFPEDEVEHEEEEAEVVESEAAPVDMPVESQGGEKVKGPAAGERDAGNGEEIEVDDWVIDFANLFRHHLGIDPDSHVDIHELGMELCQQAMDETVSCPDAMPLFEAAAMKFEEVVALAYHNWGNVHTCIAKKHLNDDPHGHVHGRKEGEELQPRKRTPETFAKAKEHFAIAAQKYQEALKIKAEFSDAIVGWGQLLFENAKLELERTIQDAGEDREQWEKLDFSEAVQLFGEAEAKMIAAERAIEDTQRMMLLKQKEQEQAEEGPRAVSDRAAESAQDPVMLLNRFEDYRRQVQLCHGNILFEHSILDYRVGGAMWDLLLAKAVTKFMAAGAAKDDVVNALKNHPASVKNVLQLSAKSTLQILPNQSTETEVPVPQLLEEAGASNNDENEDNAARKAEGEAEVEPEVMTESDPPQVVEAVSGEETSGAGDEEVALPAPEESSGPADLSVPPLVESEKLGSERNGVIQNKAATEEVPNAEEDISLEKGNVNGMGSDPTVDEAKHGSALAGDKVNGGTSANKKSKKTGRKKAAKAVEKDQSKR